MHRNVDRALRDGRLPASILVAVAVAFTGCGIRGEEIHAAASVASATAAGRAWDAARSDVRERGGDPRVEGTGGASPAAAVPPAGPDATTADEAGVPAGAGGPHGGWLSGASGESVASGDFGRWRGRAVEIAGTWCDSLDGAEQLYPLQPGGEYGAWQGDLDIAVGAIWKSEGESWAAAAAGAYDGRWEAQLTRLRDLWGARPGTLWIRFAHEFNGGWQPWSVRGSEVADFTAGWRRYRALQQRILPRHRLVWAPNDGTDGSLRLDVRRAFPGAGQADAVGVSTYNWWPYVDTEGDFVAKITGRYADGAPLGLEAWRQQAEQWGLPLAISEWSQQSDPSSPGGGGDSPVYVRRLHEWLHTFGGGGPGDVVYEVLFTVTTHGENEYGLYPTTRMPATAGTYRDLW